VAIPFIIFYRVKAEAVEILRINHSAQDCPLAGILSQAKLTGI
jgi:plasmid stabilization system protein ParE